VFNQPCLQNLFDQNPVTMFVDFEPSIYFKSTRIRHRMQSCPMPKVRCHCAVLCLSLVILLMTWWCPAAGSRCSRVANATGSAGEAGFARPPHRRGEEEAVGQSLHAGEGSARAAQVNVSVMNGVESHLVMVLGLFLCCSSFLSRAHSNNQGCAFCAVGRSQGCARVVRVVAVLG
jgi:hypothetical protein